jgi:hypothetical protein
MYADSEPRWERVCAAPCLSQLPAAGEYRIGGDGVTPSSSFALRSPSLDLRVSPGSASARRAGSYAALFGFLTSAVGGIVLALSAFSKDEGSAAANHVAIIGGSIGLIAGGTVGLVGLGVVFGTATSVSDVQGRDLPKYVGPLALIHATGRF